MFSIISCDANELNSYKSRFHRPAVEYTLRSSVCQKSRPMDVVGEGYANELYSCENRGPSGYRDACNYRGTDLLSRTKRFHFYYRFFFFLRFSRLRRLQKFYHLKVTLACTLWTFISNNHRDRINSSSRYSLTPCSCRARATSPATSSRPLSRIRDPILSYST